MAINGDINRARDTVRTSKFWQKGVSVIVKRNIINHGLIRNVQNWLNEGSRLNYSGYRTQVT
jgi:ABC-type cobalamin transport system ATPase subunit